VRTSCGQIIVFKLISGSTPYAFSAYDSWAAINQTNQIVMLWALRTSAPLPFNVSHMYPHTSKRLLIIGAPLLFIELFIIVTFPRSSVNTYIL